MIIELAFLLLNPSELPVVNHPWRELPVCDDGSSPWHNNHTPNWSCELQGCNAQDPSCWPERLEHCSDDTGDLGFCVYAVIECKSKYACFEQFMYCEGVYECLDDESWIGCGHGRCTTDTSDDINPKSRFTVVEDLSSGAPAKANSTASAKVRSKNSRTDRIPDPAAQSSRKRIKPGPETQTPTRPASRNQRTTAQSREGSLEAGRPSETARPPGQRPNPLTTPKIRKFKRSAGS